MSRKKPKRAQQAEPAAAVTEKEAGENVVVPQSPPYQEIDVEALGLTEEAMQLLERLATERDEAVAGRQRALADFRNYQRRSLENETRALERGKTSVVRSLLSVLDQFDMAIEQSPDQVTVEQLLAGIAIVRDEMVRALGDHGLRRIAPPRGAEFDPTQHEALMREPAESVPSDHVVQVFQKGYAVGDVVVRPAKVTIADPSDTAGDDELDPELDEIPDIAEQPEE
jgi:molecular chaperone GrpE